MKCINCSAEIPPAWVSCLQSNICPGCGKEIMDEPTKTLLQELKEAMLKMPNDPEGLAGWLVSNYHLQKVGDGEPTSFHRAQEKQIRPSKSLKRKSNLNEDNDEEANLNEGEKLTSDEDASVFAKRAGIAGLTKNKNLAAMAKQIKQAGGINPDSNLIIDDLELDEEGQYQDDGLDIEPDIDPSHEAKISRALGGKAQISGSANVNEFQKLKVLEARQKMSSGQGGFSRR